MSTLLQASRLTKRFSRQLALVDVSFSVMENEICGLIGPNGSGKTTLFECLAGLRHSDAGTVDCPAGLFYMPDGICPWPDQRLREVLQFFASIYARSTNEISRLVADLDLTPLLQARIGTLSKGERKRSLLALALLTTHPLLLLDEPFDGLDFRQTLDVAALLRSDEVRRGRTLFLSIHQLSDAARVCDRLVLLSRGHVAGEGTLDELRRRAGLESGGLEEVFLALT